MDTMKHVIGAGLDSPEDLEDRIRVVEDKVRRDAREIVEVLKLDFPNFVERQARERYTQAPGSFRLDKDGLAAVKASVRAAGEQAVATIIPQLEDDALWLDAPRAVPEAGERRDLKAHAKVWATIQSIGGLLQGVLVKHGFPGAKTESFADVYRMPTWFISGRLIVSLVESYWRNLEERETLRATLEALREQGARQVRGDEWDAV